MQNGSFFFPLAVPLAHLQVELLHRPWDRPNLPKKGMVSEPHPSDLAPRPFVFRIDCNRSRWNAINISSAPGSSVELVGCFIPGPNGGG